MKLKQHKDLSPQARQDIVALEKASRRQAGGSKMDSWWERDEPHGGATGGFRCCGPSNERDKEGLPSLNLVLPFNY